MAPDAGQQPTADVWRFSLLGELQIVHAGRPAPSPPHRTHPLLAALLLDRGPQRRDRLVGMLFPDAPERTGRRRLSDLLWLLRRSLPGLPLETTAQSIELSAASRWLDVEDFQRGATGSDPAEWQAALVLYRGELLPGCYDDWLLFEREALHLRYVQLLHRACNLLLEQRQFETALPLAQRLANEEPFDEGALCALMKAHAALGQRGAALAAYERFIGLAADELGMEPDEATQALARAIRTAAPSPVGFPSPVADGASPDTLLLQARTALERGDWATAELCLDRLEPAGGETAVQMLQVDLALLREDTDQAGQILDRWDWDGAAKVVRRAALSLAKGQTAAAHDLASRALLLAHDEQDRPSELEALLVLAPVQRKLGQNAPASFSADQALELARQLDSPAGVVRAQLVQGTTLIRQGRYREALSILRQTQSLARERGLRRFLGQALYGLGRVHLGLGAFLDALVFIQDALSVSRDLGLRRQEAHALQFLGIIYDQLGRNAEALRATERCLQIYEQIGDQFRVAASQYNLAAGLPYFDEALLDRAVALATEAIAAFRALDRPGWEASALATLGYLLWLDGQHPAALDALRQAYTRHQQRGEAKFLPELLAYQGLAHLGLGAQADALDCTRRALLTMAQGPIESHIVPEIYYAHAMALAAHGRESQAHEYLTRAYHILLEHAEQLEEESARQAFFQRDPIVRRLMQEVTARGIAPDPQSGVVTRRLPARAGRHLMPVKWTLDAGPPDIALKRAKGAVALRRSRLARILRESRTQGARPTVQQLADTLGVSPRTIKRDLAALRRADPAPQKV